MPIWGSLTFTSGASMRPRQYFQQGLKLDPHNSTCLFNLGLIAERQGDTATADKLFQEVLRYNPDYSDALLELANLRGAARRSYRRPPNCCGDSFA